MHRSAWILLSIVFLALPAAGWSFYQRTADPGVQMTTFAEEWVASLDQQQKKSVMLPYNDKRRVDWHFIPKDERKGLQLKHMSKVQREMAHKLLESSLSELGYKKATTIMSLEALLHELEAGQGRNIRDPERYYFTLFGSPELGKKWGLSIEGHHLSLNYVVDKGRIISSTPQFFAANPTIVNMENTSGIPLGTRVLAKEEELAFKLVNLLSDVQQEVAVIDKTAPSEIRGAGDPQPPQEAAVGLRFGNMTEDQQGVMKQLAAAYLEAMPASVQQSRRDAIRDAGADEIHFAWAGALEPGIGHYYRIQGETFLIEFVNTQPDAAGNPASHIHCVWRDMQGDFALPIR